MAERNSAERNILSLPHDGVILSRALAERSFYYERGRKVRALGLVRRFRRGEAA